MVVEGSGCGGAFPGVSGGGGGTKEKSWGEGQMKERYWSNTYLVGDQTRLRG